MDHDALAKRRYTLNTGYFDRIKTPEQAYWLGYVLSAGSLRTRSRENSTDHDLYLQLPKEDWAHLARFKMAIGYGGPVKTAVRGTRVRLTMYSKHMVTAITEAPRPKYSLEVPYVQGIYDGTARLYYRKHVRYPLYLHVRGTPGLPEQLYRALRRHIPKLPRGWQRHNEHSTQIAWHGIHTPLAILRWIYQPTGVPRLPSKHNDAMKAVKNRELYYGRS